MGIEVRRHCKKCQTNFTAAVPEVKDTLKCPYCGADIPKPDWSPLSSPVRDETHPVSGVSQVQLF